MATPEEMKARGDFVEPAADDAAAKDAAEKAKAAAEAAPKPEDELEETPEEKAEREAAEEAAERKRRQRVPLARLDEVIAKGREREAALQQRIAQLEQAQARPTEDVVAKAQKQLDDLQDKYEAALVDGKVADAKQHRAEITKLSNLILETKTQRASEQARISALETTRYDLQLQQIENQYPVLNPEHSDYDQAVADEVEDLMDSFIARGYRRDVALTRAVKYVVGTPGKGAKSSPETAAATREIAARKAAADASKKQPAAPVKGIGKDHDRDGKPNTHGIDVFQLSQERFAEIAKDPALLARLRGDEVT